VPLVVGEQGGADGARLRRNPLPIELTDGQALPFEDSFSGRRIFLYRARRRESHERHAIPGGRERERNACERFSVGTTARLIVLSRKYGCGLAGDLRRAERPLPSDSAIH
jgi:hypothetical protein